MNFHDFSFSTSLQDGLDSMGFVQPTPIQEQTIPLIQQGNDLIACAQTGTGKTAAYLLPVMDRLCKMQHRKGISVLILVPTRELAIQVDQQVEGLAYFTGLTSIAIYGGGDGIGYEQQRRSLREGVDIVVATPGRLISHIQSSKTLLHEASILILDEADRMLDMGFKDDIMQIVRKLPTKRNTLLFSATMPGKTRQFANQLLHNPQKVNIAISKPAERIKQLKYKVHDAQKIPLVCAVLKPGQYQSVLIFASTKEKVKQLDKNLRKLGLQVKPFHSDLSQDERQKILLEYKNKHVNILVGTDVLSRGIDVEGIDLVINYDVPGDPEDYIHRIGRTARAERTGTAISLVNMQDKRRFKQIEELMEQEVAVEPLPEDIAKIEAKEAPVSHRRDKPGKKKRHFRKRPHAAPKSE